MVKTVFASNFCEIHPPEMGEAMHSDLTHKQTLISLWSNPSLSEISYKLHEKPNPSQRIDNSN